jgi:hypothetical protein
MNDQVADSVRLQSVVLLRIQYLGACSGVSFDMQGKNEDIREA